MLSDPLDARLLVAKRQRPFGLEARVEIDSRLLPATLHGALGNSAHRGNFPEGEAAEELEIDYLGERRVDLGKLLERIAQQRQLAIVHCKLAGLRGERR